MKTVSLRRSLLVLAAAALAALGGLFAVAPTARADTAAVSVPQPVAPPQVPSMGLPSFAPLAESVKAAVVNVEVASRARNEGSPEMFEQFFGGGGRHPQMRQGAGSGFIIDGRGYIITNNHVVENAVSIRVKMDDGRVFDGQVLGTDPATDVALVKLKNPPANLAVLKLGDSDAMRVGDWVVAIGNPFGLASSVSVGILSAKARNIGGNYDDFLQTDAAINPGNSGGPLFNLKGEVIGINTAIVSGGSGIGFAVPSNLAKSLLPQLEKNGLVTRGFIGIGLQKLTPELAKALGAPSPQGALVTLVQPDKPGARAGLKQDDVITQVDAQTVTSVDNLRRTIALRPPGSTVNLTVYRAGKPREVKVVLTKLEEEVARNGPAEHESHDESNKEQFGLSLATPSPELARARNLPRGAFITEVQPGSPADKAGLEPNLLVTEANHQLVGSAGDLSRILRAAKPGTTILIRAQARGGEQAASMLYALEAP
jgi:serine protease Do